ncbi:class IV adenylate cyclase [Miniphocaeibacter massiliensis]|uniref:class IV adenylate cyclase n=1 Tax=Miniphocaeibacter massiliensis TaxID=2041841 RepID=UPI0013EBBC06|nr:class IV adenylate cyclase [Miniphocaeibacter massiliensis]
MERELEFKLLGLDLDYYKNLLEEKGAKLIAHEKQINTVVSSESFPLIDEDCYLRIREVKDLLNSDNKIEFTFKKKVKNELVRENYEYTTEVSSKEGLINILRNLKFNKYITGTKERASYNYKNLRLDFDTWDKDTYPYPYIEIESSNEKDIYDFLKEFNISKNHISLKSITDLKNELKSKQ